MTEKNMQLVSNISERIGCFPDLWQDYQAWLRDIVSSRSALLSRYPVWQARFIFRWRLLYFVGYVGGVFVFRQCLKGLKKIAMVGRALRDKVSFGRDAIAARGPSFETIRYILQRTATLLAVAELTLCGIAALTGILIAFYYQPAAIGAHASLTHIEQNIASGALILSLHNVAGNGLIGLALVQIVVMFLGREFSSSWFAGWMSGLFLTLTAIGLSWSAIVLNWGQTSFWRFKVELSIVASIPWIGPMLSNILAGGSGINSLTLQHMYALHSYVLASVAILLSLIHLTALFIQEQHWKPAKSQISLGNLCKGIETHRD